VADDPTPNTPIETRAREVINALRPHIQMDGGDIEFIDYNDGVVRVRLHGACTGCPHAAMTLKVGVERQLRQHVPQVKEVVNVG
jgi:Fe-S cluster biogenesis protein NfuA